MDRVVSGQAYLYRERGTAGTVVEVRLHADVRGDLLQEALDRCLVRFPYLAQRLVETGGRYYLHDDPLPPVVARTREFRPLGGDRVGHHLLDVTHVDDTVRVAFHHALCDGRGVKPFVETLVHLYCCLRYGPAAAPPGLRLPGDALLPGETSDPFDEAVREALTDRADRPDRPVPHPPAAGLVADGYELPELASADGRHRRHEVHLDGDLLVAHARRHGATPAALLSAMASEAVLRAHPGADVPVVCSAAVDLRAALGHPHTYKNCVGTADLPCDREQLALPLGLRAARQRDMLRCGTTPAAARRTVAAQAELFRRLDALPTLHDKVRLMAFLDDVRVNTYVLSYLGRMEYGPHADRVASTHLYSDATSGLVFTMVFTGRTAVVDVLQGFPSEAVLGSFLEVLDEAGLEHRSTSGVAFATARDELLMGAGR